MTLVFIVSISVIAIAYDIWVGVKNGAAETISVVSYEFAKKYPIFPFIVGVVLGHIFWAQ